MYKVPQQTIMVHGGPGVDNYMLAHLTIDLDNGTLRDNAAFINFRAVGDDRGGVNDNCKSNLTGKFGGDRLSDLIVSYSNKNRIVEPKIARDAILHWISQYFLYCWIIIENPVNGLCCINHVNHHPGLTGCPINIHIVNLYYRIPYNRYKYKIF